MEVLAEAPPIARARSGALMATPLFKDTLDTTKTRGHEARTKTGRLYRSSYHPRHIFLFWLQ